MEKDNTDRERGNPLPPHEIFFPISSKGSRSNSEMKYHNNFKGSCIFNKNWREN